MMKKISVVIPVYNNEGSLVILYEKLIATIKSYNPEFAYELIFINDGSRDNSLAVLKELQQKDSGVVLINFSRNLAGWKHATGDAVINISADLQDPPEQIGKMLFEWENNNEIVINYREARNDEASSALTSKLAYMLLRYTLPSLPPGGFDFALLDRKAMDAVNSIHEKNRFYQGDILWVGFTIKYLPYIRLKREHGKSAYNFMKRQLFPNPINVFIRFFHRYIWIYLFHINFIRLLLP
jgi:dolichol-phosphate mannosyltransferase